MPYDVTVKQDNLPDGAEISITGLGTLKNGETTEISDEQAEFFRVMNGRLVDTEDEEGNVLVGNYERKLGPTLEKAEIYGLTIKKKVKKSSSASSSETQDKPVNDNSGEQTPQAENSGEVK